MVQTSWKQDHVRTNNNKKKQNLDSANIKVLMTEKYRQELSSQPIYFPANMNQIWRLGVLFMLTKCKYVRKWSTNCLKLTLIKHRRESEP